MTLQEIVEQLRACRYECEAGPIENNVAWRELERMAQAEQIAAALDILQALAFAKPVILSGEPWTETCERVIQGAINKAKGAVV